LRFKKVINRAAEPGRCGPPNILGANIHEVKDVQFNVAQLLKQGTGETREYDIEESELLLGDSGEVSTVEGRVRLTRTPDGVLADARLTLVANRECARCLMSFRDRKPVHVEELYYPTLDIESGQRLSPNPDPEALLIDGHHILDLTEPVRQYRWIVEDLAPLCRPACKGLCPVCGLDLNQNPSHQHEAPSDSRWSALEEMAGRLKD
jgi:DUF177 domain-containing protein